MSEAITSNRKALRASAPLPAPPAAAEDPVRREVIGLVTLGGAFLLALTLFSHRPPQSALDAPRNLIGPVGAFVADVLFFTIGLGSFIIAILAVFAACSMLFGRRVFTRRSELVGYGMLLVAGTAFFGVTASEAQLFGYAPGGMLGTIVGGGLALALGSVGAAIITGVVALASIVLVTEMSLIALIERVLRRSGRDVGGLLGRWMSRRPRPAAASRTAPRTPAPVRDDGARFAGSTLRTSLATFRGLFQRAERQAQVRTIAPGEPLLGADDDGDDPPWAAALTVPPGSAVAGSDAWSIDDDGPAGVTPTSRTARSDYAATTVRPLPRATKGPRTRVADVEPVVAEPALDEATAAPVESARAARPAPTSQSIGPVIVESAAQKARKRAADLERAEQQRLNLGSSTSAWEPPPLSFLGYDEGKRAPIDHVRLREKAVQLESTFASFKVRGRVTGICPGPVVTRFEYEPEQGTKVARIASLSDDIAMALKAQSVRIIAPIPGKGCVGIELPNETRETVYLKEILADERFTSSRSKMTVGLGKDIEGNPVVADLARMPHLLVAGTTGSGKSVTVNSMIVSILYNASPDDVRMILIDPKQLEFSIYKDIPHLLLPVVTDPTRASAALQWAVQEMERRYKLMSELKVRDLMGYNRKLKELQTAHEEALAAGRDLAQVDELLPMLDVCDPDGRRSHRHMTYILVVVDEFADLMMVAKKDVETSVARLAQKARAAGIHVVLATQRPSVDVITGLIKANFPTRLSCRLMSGIDSRTVLDDMGAEQLLGQGDMLFRPPGRSDLVRVHGAWVDEREIEKITDFLKVQREPEYDESILQAGESAEDDEEELPEDPLYEKGVRAVIEAGFASISMVQRKLGIGYNRAAKMVELMERRGIVGPAQGGSARREILNAGGYADV
jgi:S-DNA-T family DNA segregation ATPase FtsK/SpoIIIE